MNSCYDLEKQTKKLDLWYFWFYFKQLTIPMPTAQLFIYFFFFFTRPTVVKDYQTCTGILGFPDQSLQNPDFIMSTSSLLSALLAITHSHLNLYHSSAFRTKSKGKTPMVGERLQAPRAVSQTFRIKKVKLKQVTAPRSSPKALASPLMTRISPESAPERGYREETGWSRRFPLSTDPACSR